LLDFPFIQYRSYYVPVEFGAAQKFSRPARFGWNDLSDGFTAFGYYKRLARTGNFVDKRQAVGLELTGRYGFGLTAHGQIV